LPRWAGTTSARGSGLARHQGISPRFVASSTCWERPLDRKSRARQVHERLHTGSPTGDQHSRVLRKMRVLEGITGTVARRRAPAR
jgi:hypothetical protein